MSAGWCLATDWRDVHALLLRSDQDAGVRSATPAPRRDPRSTRHLVQSRRCYVYLGADDRPLSTVSLTPDPAFDPSKAAFAAVPDPLYQRRLAVDPDRGDAYAWLGAQTVLYAQDIAVRAGAGAIRCEINTRIHDVDRLLHAAGFRTCAPASANAGPDLGWLEWLTT